MRNKIWLSLCLSIITLNIHGGNTETRNVNIGDKLTVYTTSHSNIQSVLWDWDSSILELQGSLYETSTSATFKAIKPTSTSGTVIQATMYYYKDGTTSSGINKDVDVWKIHVKGNGGDESPVNPYTSCQLNKTSVTMGCDEYLDLETTTYNGSYTGKFHWSSSNPNVVTISTAGKNARILAHSPGFSTIKVALDNGNFAKCEVTVTEESRLKQLQFTLNDDNKSYSVSRKDGEFPKGEIVVPSYYNGNPVTTVAEGGFSYVSGITSVILPPTITTIQRGAFESCHSLLKIEIPNTVTYIGTSAFNYCKKLESVNIPTSLQSIPNYAFNGCESLTSINLPNRLQAIGTQAFDGCKNIKSIDIPSSVSEIGFGALGCENLSKIYVHWFQPVEANGSIFLYQELYTTATLYVPKECLNNYRNSKEWCKFKYIKEGNYYSGIDEINVSKPNKVEVHRYNTSGVPVDAEYHGIIIIQYSDGSFKKELIR